MHRTEGNNSGSRTNRSYDLAYWLTEAVRPPPRPLRLRQNGGREAPRGGAHATGGTYAAATRHAYNHSLHTGNSLRHTTSYNTFTSTGNSFTTAARTYASTGSTCNSNHHSSYVVVCMEEAAPHDAAETGTTPQPSPANTVSPSTPFKERAVSQHDDRANGDEDRSCLARRMPVHHQDRKRVVRWRG